MNKDVLSGLVLLALSAWYYWASGNIADSTLSDEVGAGGLPRLLSYALAGLGLLLVVRAVAIRKPVRSAASGPDGSEEAGLGRAVGVLVFGAAYVFLLPFIGYILAVALMIGSIALYEGAQRRWSLPAAAFGGAFLYWLLFVKLLGVRQPAGSLWQGLIG